MATQAKAGGEIGINGEFYTGGQFMAGSAQTVKGMQNGSSRKAKTRKMEIEPFVWAEQPASNMRPLFRKFGFAAIYNGGNPIVNRGFNPQSAGWRITYQQAMAEAEALIEDWNRGERWEAINA